MSNLRIAVFVLISAALVGACVDEVELGSTEQDITFGVQRYFDCTTQDCTYVVLGSASDVTCFLAGVVGHIDGIVGPPTYLSDVYVGINESNQWQLIAPHGARQVVTTCISATANRTWGASWPISGAESVLGPTSEHRQCFLKGVTMEDVTPAYNNSFYVRHDRNFWYVGATKPWGSPGHAMAYGVCVDVPSFVGTFPISHDLPGVATQFLVPSQNTNNACGLSKLNGAFMPVGSPGPYPGVRIYMLPDWVATVNEHAGGEVTCVSGTPGI